MQKTTKQFLSKYLLGAAILVGGASSTFATSFPIDVLGSGYDYRDNDLYNAVQAGLTQVVVDRNIRLNNTITAGVRATDGDVILDNIATQAWVSIVDFGMGLIPVNQGGGHWNAIALRRNGAGELVIIYNDSIGGTLASNAEASDMVRRIRLLEGGAVVHEIDAQVRNQNSGVACGAYTAEYLVQFAQISEGDLNEAYVRNLLKNLTILKDERVLRSVQYLKSIDPAQDTDTLVGSVVNAVTAHESAVQLHSITTNHLDYITADLTSRMNGLVVSGDENTVQYGAWVSGSVGRGVHKVKNSALLSSAKERSNSISFGADVKLSDAYTIGVFSSLGKNNIKSSINGNLGSTSKTDISSTVFGLYGGAMVTEDIMLSTSVYGGKLSVKNKDVSKIGSNRKGSLMGANLGATYYYNFVENVLLAPTIGVNASQVKLGKDGNAVLSINSLTGKRVSLYTGFALSKSFDIGDFSVKPEVSARVSYTPIMKSNKTIVTVLSSNTALPISPISSTNKTMFSLGASVNVVKSKAVELSIGYQKDWQSEYNGDTGFAKLRINF
jgi:hypothetical protein